MRIHHLFSLLCCLVSCTAVVAADAPRYRVTKITDGTQKGQVNGVAYAINDLGDVVGRASSGAFVWKRGQFTFLTLPTGSKYGLAQDVNNRGQIVGTYLRRDGKNQYFFWQNGKIQNLGEAPREIANPCINNKGQVLLPIMERYVSRAVLWQNGQRKDIGAFVPASFNDHTQVTGVRFKDPSINARTKDFWGIIWEKGQLHKAGSVGSFVTLINNKRDHLLIEPISATPRYYLVKAGKRADITSRDKSKIILNAINDKCQLVGFSDDENTEQAAIFWQSGQWSNLNDLIPRNSGWVLKTAQDINEKGQIIGYGTHGGVACTFLLTPTQ